MLATETRFRCKILAAALAGFAALGAGEGSAVGSDEISCAARSRVVAGLEQVFGEAQLRLELAADESLMELFASTGEGTWTLLRSTPDGQSCIVASGQGALPASVSSSSRTAFEL